MIDSVTWHDLGRLVPVGRRVSDISRGDVTAFPDPCVVSDCAGLLTCSGRPFGQTRRWRIRRVGTRVLKSNSSRSAAEERVRTFERPG